MAGVYAYTPDIWLPLAATVCLAAIAAYSWWRRDVPAALPLAACALFAALWGLGRTLVAAAAAPAAILAWHKFQVIWLLPAVTAGTCFALEYARPGRWLTRRRAWLVALFALPPLLILLLVILNDGQLLWRRLEIAADGLVQPTFTRAGLILLAYGMGLVLVNAAALVWLFARSPQHRWPVVLILFGQSANRLLYLFGTLAPLRPPLFELDATAGIVPWQNGSRSSSGRPKRSFSARKSRSGLSVAGLVITANGMRTPNFVPVEMTFSIRICSRVFCETGPIGNIPFGCSNPSRVPWPPATTSPATSPAA